MRNPQSIARPRDHGNIVTLASALLACCFALGSDDQAEEIGRLEQRKHRLQIINYLIYVGRQTMC